MWGWLVVSVVSSDLSSVDECCYVAVCCHSATDDVLVVGCDFRAVEVAVCPVCDLVLEACSSDVCNWLYSAGESVLFSCGSPDLDAVDWFLGVWVRNSVSSRGVGGMAGSSDDDPCPLSC